MKKFLRTFCAVLSAAVLVTAASCSGDNSGSDTPAAPAVKPVATESISLSETNVYLQKGSTKQLSVTFTPANSTDKTIIWTAQDQGGTGSSVATVDQKGLVSAAGTGVSLITATLKSNSEIKQVCRVTVVENLKPVESVTVKDSKDQKSGEAGIGRKVYLTATVTPDDATVKDVIWTSSNDKIATVTSTSSTDAYITGISEGTATIKVKSSTTESIFDVYDVTVSAVKTQSIAINSAGTTVIAGKTLQLVAAFIPDDATNKKVNWSSSDNSIATVSETGLVSALACGEVTITAAATDGTDIKGSLKITVIPVPVTGVKLNTNSTSVNEGKTVQLSATVSPEDAGNKKVTWKSSNESAATVDENGLVSGVAAGSADITATTEDGSFTATCTVTVVHVNVSVSGVSLDSSNTSIEAGKTQQLTATVMPENADNKSVIWSSDNEAVAKVSDKGLVTAVKEGSAVITVKTNDGSFTATCSVTVTKAVLTAINLKSEESVVVGLTATLTPVFVPANAVPDSLEWTSSDSSVATVNNSGVVRGIKKGTTTITVKAPGNISATCNVSVTEIGVYGITINYEGTQTIYTGETLQITATLQPENATDKTCKYEVTTGDSDIVSISSTGLVTGLKSGHVTIKVTANGATYTGSGYSYRTFEVDVKDKPYPVIDISKGGYTSSTSDNRCVAYPGFTGQLTATMSDLSDSTYTWSSSNPEAFSVDNDGNITYLKSQTGSYYNIRLDGVITCTAANGQTSSVNVRCGMSNEFVLGDSSWLYYTDTQSVKINSTLALKLYIPSAQSGGCIMLTGTINGLKVTSSNESVATVTVPAPSNVYGSAVLNILAAGTSTITCTLGDYTRSFVIKASDVTSVQLNKTQLMMVKGKTETLTATVLPSTAADKSVTWSSSDSSIAEVDSNGVVTAVSVGTATITVKSNADDSKQNTCSVTIRNAAYPVLNYSDWPYEGGSRYNEICGFPGATGKIPVTMNDGSESAFTYTSSNEYIKFDSDGTINFTGTEVANTTSFDQKATVTITSVATGESITVYVRSSFYNQFLWNGGNWASWGSQVTMKAGNSIDFRAMYNISYFYGGCSGISNDQISFTVSDSSVAVVIPKSGTDQFFTCTALKAGLITVTGTVGGVTKFFYINVTE